jgi:glutamine synthetase
LIHTREIITNTASKYGLRATLAPRVYMDNCAYFLTVSVAPALTIFFSSPGGSSIHTHLSVHSTNTSSANAQPVTEGLTSHEASFLSSLLDHIPGLTALTLPQPASYKRVGDGVWSGGTYVCWGTDNREAPIRLCNASSSRSRNFELRFVDGLANVSPVKLFDEYETHGGMDSLT